METDNDIIALSGKLLLTVKMGNVTADLEQNLSALSLIKLNSELHTDEAKNILD